MNKRKCWNIVLTALMLCASVNTLVSVYAQEVSQSQNTPPNKVFNPKNPISLARSEWTISNSAKLTKEMRYDEAQQMLAPTVEWLENSTEYHTALYKLFKSMDDAKAQAAVEKELAFKSAMLRDKAYYQFALLKIVQDNPSKAAELLVKVVTSEPTSELGFKAYEKLQEIGFTYKAQLEQPKE